MGLTTPAARLLGIRHPIVLAPMGNTAGAALATAVTQAGGLGLVGCGYADRGWVERELALADLSQVGVGFITWSLRGREAVFEQALARRPRAVFLSFGDPAPYLPAIRAAGSRLICQVQTVADAVRAAELGADVIVAQGTEAGGHGATRGTLALVPAVVDGRGIAAALVLGAQGAVVGTRFLATPESLMHPNGKARVVSGKGDDTLRTRVFDIVRGKDWPLHFTGRALRNAFTERWHGDEERLARNLTTEKPRYAEASAAGDMNTSVVFAGEGMDLIHEIAPAQAVLSALLAETLAALGRGAGFAAD
jgi:nitronate monooxygenase